MGQPARTILYHNNRDIAVMLPGTEDAMMVYCENKDKWLRDVLLKTFVICVGKKIPKLRSNTINHERVICFDVNVVS